MGMKCNIIVALICISQIISDIELLVICLLAIYVSSLDKYLFSPLPDFKLVGLLCCCIIGVSYIL